MVNPFISSWQIYRTLIVDGMYYLRTNKNKWLPLLSCCFAIVLYLLLLPVFLQQLIDQSYLNQSGSFQKYFLILTGIAIIFCILVTYYQLSSHLFSQSIVSELFHQLYQYFIFQSPFYYPEGAHKVFEQSLHDVEKIKYCLRTDLPQIVIYFLLVTGSFITIWIVSPELTTMTLLMIVCVVVSILFGLRYDRIPQQKIKALQQQEVNFILPRLEGMTTIQAFDQQDSSINTLTNMQYHHSNQYKVLFKTKAIFLGLSVFIACCALLLILWYGYFMSSQARLSLGTLCQYIVYVAFIVFALRKLMQTQQHLFSVAQSYFNLKTLLNTDATIQSPLIPDQLSDTVTEGLSIELKSVSYRYPNNQEYPAIHHMNLVINAGECIAIAAPQGAGKSTLLHLLLRFIDPSEGQILFNHSDIRWLSLHNLREQIGYIPQKTFLFPGTILENIRLGYTAIEDEDIIQITRFLDIEQHFSHLDKGFYTPIQSEADIGLLLGYYISLVRAMIHQPTLLLIDEITNTLDPQSEAILYEAIQRATQHATSLIVTHHHPTMQKADRILRIEHGEIIAFEPYDILFKKQ